MADAAHLVGGQAGIFPRVLLGHVGDAQGFVEVLHLGFARRELPAFLVPHDVGCWSEERGADQSFSKGQGMTPKSGAVIPK